MDNKSNELVETFFKLKKQIVTTKKQASQLGMRARTLSDSKKVIALHEEKLELEAQTQDMRNSQAEIVEELILNNPKKEILIALGYATYQSLDMILSYKK